MANMSYCRFRNTLSDFKDCVEHFMDKDLDAEEHNARRFLVLEMLDVLSELGVEIESDTIDSDIMEKKSF